MTNAAVQKTLECVISNFFCLTFQHFSKYQVNHNSKGFINNKFVNLRNSNVPQCRVLTVF